MESKCFAQEKSGRCIALSKGACRGCRFFKTKDQMQRDTEEANNRLNSLPATTQQVIADTYTGGKLVWQK